MFRMLRLKPPNGWHAVAWELAIVTVGVLMALGLQQWAENLASKGRANKAREAIRQELRAHYLNAVEWRRFSPCVAGQLDLIEKKIASSAAVLQPIPARKLDGRIRVTIVAPRRSYDDSAWTGAISEGTRFQLTDRERWMLSNAYTAASWMVNTGRQFDEADTRLLSASRPLDLSPDIKHSLFQSIDQIHSANERMDRFAAEIIAWVTRLGAAPSQADIEYDLRENSGSVTLFCNTQTLRMREISAAVDFSTPMPRAR